jgi:hypothetical protein
MPDNWGFVAAAYGLTALVLGLYWRHLVRKEHELRRTTAAHAKTSDSKTVDVKTADAKTAGSEHPVADTARTLAGTARAPMESTRSSSDSDHEIAERSRQPSGPGHPRNDPASRHPLQ